jgi:hypothetical protein
MVRATNEEDWIFAVDSVDEWLRGACELVSGGDTTPEQAHLLAELNDSLTNHGPLQKGSLDSDGHE